MSDNIKEFPLICCNEKKIKETTKRKDTLYVPISNIDESKVTAAFGIALHMHQPAIPAASDDLEKTRLINNLEYMMRHQEIHDNHNAPVFLKCYSRMSDIIRDLVKEGRNPRVMLDYSGNLLWGLKQMGEEQVLDNLSLVTTDKKYNRYVEWLGTMWSHAVVSSTPLPDIKLHIEAWQEHFFSIFGDEALKRIKGFSPPEMHLPIHPDICYEYIKTLNEHGYEWLMVQEHTIENIDGTGIRDPYYPHRLVAKNSLGKAESITVLIKTQGSDTKLVGQMQPYYEAKTKNKKQWCGKEFYPYVLQIGDGENGGVMMNEFPGMYKQVFGEVGIKGIVGMNGSEYLEFMLSAGIKKEQLPKVQPLSQHRIWEKINTSYTPGAADKAIDDIKKEDSGFNLDKASWTNDKDWVKGYANVMGPINKLSAEFHKRFPEKAPKDPAYREALLYLLLSQTSCFRYWGSGRWTEYAKEICRRGTEALKKKQTFSFK